MSFLVTIRCIKGQLAGKEWTYQDAEIVTIGRKEDNKIVTPENEKMISRHHCIIDINTPDVKVLDFGSYHGTFLNQKLLGKRKANQTPEEGQKNLGEYVPVPSGGVIGVGANNGTEELFQVEYKKTEAPNEYYDTALKKIKGFMDADKKEYEKNRYKGDDKYRIERKLGNGTFGEAYLVYDKETEKPFVIKTLFAGKRGTSDQAKKWFMREAGLCIQLKHPHIVRTFDFSEEDFEYKILMEYCEGGDLDIFLKRNRILNLKTATTIILQLLDTLIYTENVVVESQTKDGKTKQTQGIVHRDIKPANLLFADTTINSLKLADFGIAKPYQLAGQSAFTMSGGDRKNQRCTYAYCSKTLADEPKYVTPEVDVWAAAAVYYKMLTGEYVRDFSEKEPFFVVISEKTIPIRKRNANIPTKLADVIDRVLLEEGRTGTTSATTFKREILDTMY